MRHRPVFAFALLVSTQMGGPVLAQDVDLTNLDPERCPDVLADFSAIEAATPSTAASLIGEALRRYCAGTGGIAMPDDLAQALEDEGTRSGSALDDGMTDEIVLVAEAAYYLEIAQQIDAGAANDLLRRLLGSEPSPGN